MRAISEDDRTWKPNPHTVKHYIKHTGKKKKFSNSPRNSSMNININN